ncbi:antirestriction protein [Xenorhabdus vietnamensis]|uniref:Antirestriction protein n=1 Tax=Xenorhabdus vietnamensis TaxID=351656 RepID=A0A1Y2SJI4_9GAMM|nr:antirestriction protein [Xenorhabdus vietnamensis]OTA18192.1 antirestriction protein [Xenorhabdus vietnamensis]
MPNNELIQVDSLSLSAAFPHSTSLERLVLSFLLADTAFKLGGDYPPDDWTSQSTDDRLAYMVPTAKKTYSVFLPETAFSVTLSAEAFGLAVTLVLLTRIAVLDESGATAFRFSALREYAQHHPEEGLINSALTLKFEEDIVCPSLIHTQHNNNPQ